MDRENICVLPDILLKVVGKELPDHTQEVETDLLEIAAGAEEVEFDSVEHGS